MIICNPQRRRDMIHDGFSTTEVCNITKLPYGTLFEWMHSGLVTPSIAKPQGRGKHARWDFRDVVAIQTVQKLRQHGVSLQGLKKVVEYIQTQLAIENPLSECWLATDGQEVYLLDGDHLLALLRKKGQRTLFHVVDMRKTTAQLRAKVVPLRPKRIKPNRTPAKGQNDKATAPGEERRRTGTADS
jgi:DNA-binding transcriptional MerR regulator